MPNRLESVTIAFLLGCLLVQIMVCESVFAQASSNSKAEADQLLEKGIKLYQTSQYQESLQVLEKTLGIYRNIQSQTTENAAYINASRGEANVLTAIANVYGYLGQYNKSIEFYLQSIIIFQFVHDKVGEASSLSNLGNIYSASGQYIKAIEFYSQSLRIQDDLEYFACNPTINRQGEGGGVRQLIKAQKVKDLFPLGRIFYDPNPNFDPQTCETIRKGNKGKAYILNNLGYAYLNIESYDKATNALQKALKIFQKIGDQRGEGATLDSLGSAYMNLERYSQAIEFYQKSLAITRKSEDREGQGETLSKLGKLFAKQNQNELAIVFYKQAVNTYETIRKDISGLKKEEKESYLKTIAQTYRNLADLLLKQGRILEAQQVLELLKVEEIRAYTRNTRAVDDAKVIATNPAETKTADKHNSLIALGLRVDECEQQKCPQLSQLIQQREVIAAEYQQTAKALIREIRDRKGDDDQFFDPRKVAKMNEIVSVQPNTVLIYPLILKDKIWVLWASKGGITKSIEIPNVGLEKVSSTVLKLRNLLQSPNNLPELQQTSKQLYDWLIPAELQAELNANKIQHLIFAPDSVTRYIPMGVLFDGKKYLIENYTIATIISADLTDTTARLPNSAKSTSMLAAGLSQPVSGFSPLPNVLTEINAIVRTADNPNNGIYDGIKLLDRTFTRDNLRDNLGNHAIAHIATHGKFVSGDADKSFLVLGDGKTLPIPEIEKFRGLDKLHLVVLSACQTALGGTGGDGTEIAGISYYFLNTGAKAVIASLWEVSDESTSLLMQQFYNNLAKSTASAPITKAEAMRQAQLSLLQKQITAKDSIRRGTLAVVYDAGAKPTDNYSHPYYWSPFILIGNGW